MPVVAAMYVHQAKPFEEMHMPALQPGAVAPEFSLASHRGETLALSAYRGRRTLVSFLPFAFTGG